MFGSGKCQEGEEEGAGTAAAQQSEEGEKEAKMFHWVCGGDKHNRIVATERVVLQLKQKKKHQKESAAPGRESSDLYVCVCVYMCERKWSIVKMQMMQV